MSPRKNNAIHSALVERLTTLADPQRAVQQQAYMKSTLPFAGVSMPVLRKTSREIFADHPLPSAQAWLDTIEYIWLHAQYREQRHAAIELLLWPKYKKIWLNPDALPLIRRLIESGAWWDYVDTLASNALGGLLAAFPQALNPIVRSWSRDPNLWIRRAAILAQLKFGPDTDEKLLLHCIEGSIEDSDFFARKAIGWALRQYAKTSPDAVITYVKTNETRMSPLSKREALRILQQNGLVG
jgi:3-methyladenine DNA glycosylase AlkD